MDPVLLLDLGHDRGRDMVEQISDPGRLAADGDPMGFEAVFRTNAAALISTPNRQTLVEILPQHQQLRRANGTTADNDFPARLHLILPIRGAGRPDPHGRDAVGLLVENMLGRDNTRADRKMRPPADHTSGCIFASLNIDTGSDQRHTDCIPGKRKFCDSSGMRV